MIWTSKTSSGYTTGNNSNLTNKIEEKTGRENQKRENQKFYNTISYKTI